MGKCSRTLKVLCNQMMEQREKLVIVCCKKTGQGSDFVGLKNVNAGNAITNS